MRSTRPSFGANVTTSATIATPSRPAPVALIELLRPDALPATGHNPCAASSGSRRVAYHTSSSYRDLPHRRNFFNSAPGLVDRCLPRQLLPARIIGSRTS
jgi:hypothetical protein